MSHLSSLSLCCALPASLLLIMCLMPMHAQAGDPYSYGDESVPGLAARYPGDAGIDHDSAVLFSEMFEGETIERVAAGWDWSRGDKSMLDIDSEVDGPAGTPGRQRLRMTIHRDHEGTSADLRKILDRHYKQIYMRFYVKFDEDGGFYHHHTRLRGELNPVPHMRGGAGSRPETNFSVAIEHGRTNAAYFPTRGEPAPRPGYWRFYAYWPGMHSWQTPEGESDGRPNAFYGNNIMPNPPIAAPRGEWICVEAMVRMNSEPDSQDGALALWIDGKLAGLWDPRSENNAHGYWMRDTFRWDPDHPDAKPFPGFNWTPISDPEDLANFKNVIQLHHYVSSRVWDRIDRFNEENPDAPANTRQMTLWKDHVVVATEYIGPMVPAK